jgi:DNA-binding transcriptional MerR regulator
MAEVATMMGIDYDTLRYHVRMGYLFPPGAGRQRRRYYTTGDLGKLRAYWFGEE